jgi:copper homeostasis protein
MQVTFHRAIDMARDLTIALEDVVQTGADRVLTSGGAPTALLGSGHVAGLVEAAKERIGIMVCGSVRQENVHEIAKATGAREFHASLRKQVPSPVEYRNSGLSLGEPGNDEYLRYAVTAEDVRSLRQAMDGVLSLSSQSAG